ncbi:hypothetical protein [Breznakiella homolactica]|uniref:NfeD-like C-terminal domain-containing protein n=1 Tax=Breznakiella homolactica TaxID=2798577 RepID=A0A7T7XRK9_9SPIR|nr:hypothetical protein [Breznakiella homolactica]QQO11191.1 hypothetical protein JFL75_09860 [Breznakiella homolactica]
METLFIVYVALSVFGLGVTVVDFIGILDHVGGGSDGADGSQGSDDYGGDGHDSDGDSSDGDGHDAADHSGGDHSQDTTSDSHHGSYIAPGDTGVKAVTRIMGILRFLVYFALGAGPTGLFALLTGHTSAESLVWGGAAGLAVAVLAKLLRKLIRRDLDSSIKPSEFLMEKAEVTVPVLPGKTGKAVVRQFGKETEIYIRSKDASRSFPRGSSVRIVDYDDSSYWVESPDQEYIESKGGNT